MRTDVIVGWVASLPRPRSDGAMIIAIETPDGRRVRVVLPRPWGADAWCPGDVVRVLGDRRHRIVVGREGEDYRDPLVVARSVEHSPASSRAQILGHVVATPRLAGTGADLRACVRIATADGATHRVIAYGSAARAASYLARGDYVYCAGPLRTRAIATVGGAPRRIAEIVADVGPSWAGWVMPHLSSLQVPSRERETMATAHVRGTLVAVGAVAEDRWAAHVDVGGITHGVLVGGGCPPETGRSVVITGCLSLPQQGEADYAITDAIVSADAARAASEVAA